MITMVTFTGFSGSGKTTLVSQVVKILTGKGHKVAVIKHDGHGHNIFNQKPGSDSVSHREAGANCSIVSNSSGYSMECVTGEDKLPQELASLVPADTDLIICEGFKNSNLPKIEVVRKDSTDRANAGDPNLIAIATDTKLSGETVPLLDLNNPAQVADFLEDYLKENRQEIAFHLIVNGKVIPTKGFIQNMLTYSLHGQIKALKDCDSPKEIIIKAVYH